ncbi:phage integrase central domain-containing protein [Kribbella catacumbae]|uniref:phage integrase central domain-containing protein n=1 Tax=Kribbella catacumbae TaxID=460086 RepID=UPI0003A44BF0|nr:site-specific integrase [Kribbella catacumbae]
MAYVKDLWTRPAKQEDGTVVRERNARWGRGKRWLAGWVDPLGKERTKAFSTKGAAERHGNAMETDRERGEYIDPRAGKVRFEEVAERWLASRVVDPATAIRYESVLRLHVTPVFGRRQLRTIRPSEIAAWVVDLNTRFGSSTARAAYLVLQGILGLAVDDETLKRNPAKASVVKLPSPKGGNVVVWGDDVVVRIVEGHPPQYRPIAAVGAACGLRQGEIFGLAEEDIDFDAMVIHVRRQVKKLGRDFVFALPKNDTERTVPMSDGTALVLKDHIEAVGPRPYTLPWEKVDGGSSHRQAPVPLDGRQTHPGADLRRARLEASPAPCRSHSRADQRCPRAEALRHPSRERHARAAALLREHHARRRRQHQRTRRIPRPRRPRLHPPALHPHVAVIA